MIEPNFNIMVWVLSVGYTVAGIGRISLGLKKYKKDTHYHNGDVWTM